VIFARTPRAGRVKTRLIPAIGAEGAARLHAAFVRDVVARFGVGRGRGRGRRFAGESLLAHEGPASAFQRSLGIPLVRQRGADLGARMEAAFADAAEAGVGRTLIIGTDSPDLPERRITEAFALLGRPAVDVVLGPAVDGGYYLIGARGVPSELLRDMPWGAAQLLERTLAAARRAHLGVRLLEPWYDVDRPEDLAFLRTHVAGLSAQGEDRCPITRMLLGEQESTTGRPPG
jgi:rSAM/selenodomain-associated transferase 1